MRLYCIEDLYPEHVQRLAAALKERGLAGSMEGLYWLPAPKELLGPEQLEHPDCGPHCLALELEEDRLRLELLVRSRVILRCSCVSYATPQLRAHMMDWLDQLLRELDIPV